MHIEIYLLLHCDADFCMISRKLENFNLLVLCVILKLHQNCRSILIVTAINSLNRNYCFMLFYYQNSNLLASDVCCIAAADVGLHVGATASVPMFSC